MTDLITAALDGPGAPFAYWTALAIFGFALLFCAGYFGGLLADVFDAWYGAKDTPPFVARPTPRWPE